MLLLETVIQKQQLELQQQFCREGNFFAIPSKKIARVQQMIDSIIDQIFGKQNIYQKNSYSKVQQTFQIQHNFIVQKVKKFVISALHKTISLPTLREIFESAKKQQQKIVYYQDYFIKLDQILEFDDEVNRNRNKDFNEEDLSKMFDESMGIQSSNIITLGELHFEQKEHNFEQKTYNFDEKTMNNNKFKDQLYIPQQLDCQGQILSNSDENKNNSCSLKHEIVTSSQFTSLNEIFANRFDQSFKNITDHELNSSIELQDLQENKKQLINDRATNSTIYSPSWKIIQQSKKKMITLALGKQTETHKEKEFNLSDQFLKNLSGTFKPMPSVLNDESFSQVTRKQTRDDIRKSQAMRQSLFGFEYPENVNEKIYNFNVKTTKIQQKLRTCHRKVSPKMETSPKNTQVKVNSEKIYISPHKDELRRNSNLQKIDLKNNVKSSYQTKINTTTESPIILLDGIAKQKGEGILSSLFGFKKKRKQFKQSKQDMKLAIFIQ